MKKKILISAAVLAAVSTGVGACYAIRKAKINKTCKCLKDEVEIGEKTKKIEEKDVDVTVVPKCLITNVIITKK